LSQVCLYWKNKVTQLSPEEVIMIKLLSASVLALSVTFAVPAAAQTVQGGHLYIQDFDAPVQITYLSSYATYDTYLYIGMLDASGNLIGSFEPLLNSFGTPSDKANLGTCRDCLMTSNPYSFNPAEGTVELVFFWSSGSEALGVPYKSHYSSVYPGQSNLVDSTGNKWDKMTYGANNTATVGFEDGGGNNGIHWDWNDVVISLTNVGATRPPLPPVPPPVIPEPETWAMMLAGLGMVASVVRRRRNRVQ
jgi:hypothetical protein